MCFRWRKRSEQEAFLFFFFFSSFKSKDNSVGPYLLGPDAELSARPSTGFSFPNNSCATAHSLYCSTPLWSSAQYITTNNNINIGININITIIYIIYISVRKCEVKHENKYPLESRGLTSSQKCAVQRIHEHLHSECILSFCMQISI